MSTPGMQPKPLEPQGSGALLLHLEEYKALMNRSTALIGQMFTVMAIGFGYLGYCINNWQASTADHRPILWPGLLVEQIIILLWLFLRHAELGITVYVDTALRALCEPTVELRNSFWKYRKVLRQESGFVNFLPLWAPAITSVFAFGGVLIYRFGYMPKLPLSLWDYLAILSGAGLLLSTVVGCRQLVQLRETST